MGGFVPGDSFYAQVFVWMFASLIGAVMATTHFNTKRENIVLQFVQGTTIFVLSLVTLFTVFSFGTTLALIVIGR